MNYERSDLSVKLHEAFVVETCLIDRLREAYAITDMPWVEDPTERVRRSDEMAKLMVDLKDAQERSQRLLAAWRDAREEMPLFLSEANQAKQDALTEALESLSHTQRCAEKSKGAALTLLSKTNQMQEVLGAYRR